MKLVFKPGDPKLPGTICPLPKGWRPYLSPWSAFDCRKNDFGISLIQELKMDGFRLFIWRLQIDNPVKLYSVADRPTIAFQFMLQETIPCIPTGFGESPLEKGNYQIFYTPVVHHEAEFEPGNYESMHIEMEPECLDDASAANPGIAELVSRFRAYSEKRISMAVGNITYTAAFVISNLRSCWEPPGGLQLEMRKFILELISEYLANIYQAGKDQDLPYNPHKELMIRIKNQILLGPNVHEQTQSKLARSLGISETVLKRSFKKLFQITLSRFVRQQALARARYLLTTTHDSIGNIAEEVGYSGREALERSFRKEFNYSPSNLRTGPNGLKINT
jgi:AraC-like DNA-binding protein